MCVVLTVQMLIMGSTYRFAIDISLQHTSFLQVFIGFIFEFFYASYDCSVSIYRRYRSSVWLFGTKWKNDFKKTHNQCRTLKVWAPKKTVFTEFVNVNDNGELKGGFSIAIFCLVLREVPFRIQPVFVPFVDEMGRSRDSYDELVQKIENKSCEAVAGDITITANRTEYVDFTVPYMSSEIYMLVPAAQKWNQSLVTLLRPFSPRLWFTIIGASLFVGIAIGILEYRVGNPEFNVPFY
ncbi:putative solute-binding protein family 3/ domain of MltF [Helianthus debilis subsp. tardiflorus]